MICILCCMPLKFAVSYNKSAITMVALRLPAIYVWTKSNNWFWWDYRLYCTKAFRPFTFPACGGGCPGGIDMTSQQLKCFVLVADKLNFTKAAEEMFLSVPTVTHNIKTRKWSGSHSACQMWIRCGHSSGIFHTAAVGWLDCHSADGRGRCHGLWSCLSQR